MSKGQMKMNSSFNINTRKDNINKKKILLKNILQKNIGHKVEINSIDEDQEEISNYLDIQ